MFLSLVLSILCIPVRHIECPSLGRLKEQMDAEDARALAEGILSDCTHNKGSRRGEERSKLVMKKEEEMRE
jgi:hypothetical protein